MDNNTYIFEGKISLNDIFKIINLEDDSAFDELRKEVDSLAGLIIEIAGRIPHNGEKINYENFTFIIEAADKRRIKRVKLIIKESENSNQ